MPEPCCSITSTVAGYSCSGAAVVRPTYHHQQLAPAVHRQMWILLLVGSLLRTHLLQSQLLSIQGLVQPQICLQQEHQASTTTAAITAGMMRQERRQIQAVSLVHHTTSLCNPRSWQPPASVCNCSLLTQKPLHSKQDSSQHGGTCC